MLSAAYMDAEESQLNYLIDTLTCDKQAPLDILSSPAQEGCDRDSALRSLDITQKVRGLQASWEGALQSVSTQTISRCERDTRQLFEKVRDAGDSTLRAWVVEAAMGPLIEKCGSAHLTADEREVVGSAYASLLPAAMCVLLSEKEFTHSALVLSVCRSSSTEVYKRLFAPYEFSRLSSLEKELCYHFSRGKETTTLAEPQHFFLFLAGSLERLQKLPMPPLFNHIHGVVEWRVVSEAHLLWLAISLIESVFQWHAESLLLESSTYVVVFLNAFFDFIEAAENKLCGENVLFVGRRVAFRQSISIFLHACLEASLQALQQGPSKLWRRQFLSPRESAGAPAYYAAAVHAVRAVEAVLRRLTSSSTIERVAAADLGPCLIQPFLEAFAASTDDHLEVTAEWTNLENIVYLADIFSSLHLTIGAANDWLLVLPQGSSGGAGGLMVVTATSPAHYPRPPVMERLSTLQEQISSKCLTLLTHEAEALCHRVMETPALPFVHSFYPFELFLRGLSCVPCELLRVLLLNNAKQTFHTLLPADARARVESQLTQLNLQRTRALFAGG